jgi:hypothetical protein
VPNPSTPVIISGDCTSGIVLPVDIIHFTGQCEGFQKALVWETSNEIDNDYFRIDASKNGLDFETIDRVQGQGNSSSSKAYLYLVEDFNSEYNYFRLTQVDFNGTSSKSKVIYIEDCNQTAFANQVYYNSEDEKIHFFYHIEDSQDIEISVYDLSGKLIYTGTDYLDANSKQKLLNINVNLSRSVYLLKIQSERESYNIKLLIQ